MPGSENLGFEIIASAFEAAVRTRCRFYQILQPNQPQTLLGIWGWGWGLLDRQTRKTAANPRGVWGLDSLVYGKISVRIFQAS